MSMWTQHITYKCAESLYSIASNLCRTKENLLSKEEHSNSCASMYTFLHNTFQNAVKPVQECPAQQLKSSSLQSSEARSTVTLPASKWNAVHSSLISHTGSLTVWPPHSSAGFRGFEIICAAFGCRSHAASVTSMTKLAERSWAELYFLCPVRPFSFISLLYNRPGSVC